MRPSSLVFPLLLFLVVMAVERWRAAYSWSGRGRAWLNNVLAGMANGVLQRALLPAGLATWAAMATTQMGRAPVPWWLGVLALDLALYLQHWAMHHVPALWRLHAPHHSDDFLDVSTGLRFHPLEIGVSALWKGAVILAVGIGAETALAFETLLALSSLVSHANLAPPRGRWRLLERFWMTPALHREHHSVDPLRQRCNLTFGCTVWDWLFGTYQRSSEVSRVGLARLPAAMSSVGRRFWLLPFKINH